MTSGATAQSTRFFVSRVDFAPRNVVEIFFGVCKQDFDPANHARLASASSHLSPRDANMDSNHAKTPCKSPEIVPASLMEYADGTSELPTIDAVIFCVSEETTCKHRRVGLTGRFDTTTDFDIIDFCFSPALHALTEVSCDNFLNGQPVALTVATPSRPALIPQLRNLTLTPLAGG
uniref:Uncharacterized protein n=1 Tax=Panagrellus redivivus TaxID=6233 RepID=A0A7E4W2N7_PANRE